MQNYPSLIRRARHAASRVARAARVAAARRRGDRVGGGVGGMVVVVVDDVVGTRSSRVVLSRLVGVTASGPNLLPSS
jgi:hypothetical protein